MARRGGPRPRVRRRGGRTGEERGGVRNGPPHVSVPDVRRLGPQDVPAPAAGLSFQDSSHSVPGLDQREARVPEPLREEGRRDGGDAEGAGHGIEREASLGHRRLSEYSADMRAHVEGWMGSRWRSILRIYAAKIWRDGGGERRSRQGECARRRQGNQPRRMGRRGKSPGGRVLGAGRGGLRRIAAEGKEPLIVIGGGRVVPWLAFWWASGERGHPARQVVSATVRSIFKGVERVLEVGTKHGDDNSEESSLTW
mmetsp:Transcript_8312/g.25033  ORF Transcript_8312/g.25033 Transcript_8312/m.25033 type:complete len:254 (+) Transcript_8312:648-1409(+)